MAARSKARRRAPLMESDTEEALRRRGTELVGLVLIGVAALAAVIIWTYSPDDPSLFSATDAAPQNALGLVGASLADPLRRALGWAAYGIAAAFAVWGLRFVLHLGEGRAVGRAIAVPVALLVGATFAASHVPPAAWTDDYGLGGLLGDAVLSALLGLSPLDLTLSLRIATVALALAFVATAGYALGVTWAEARGFLRFLGQGSVVLYAGAHGLTGRAVSGAADGARAARNLAADARARRAAQLEPTLPRPAASGAIPRFDPAALRSSEDSVMAKITAAVRARAEAEAGRAGSRAVPPLTAADTDLAVLERDVPPGPDGPPEPRVQPAKPRPLPKSARARSEEEPELALDPDAPAAWRTPPLSLLQSPSTIVRHHLSNDALEENARMLENVLDDYGVRGEIVSIRPGPVVTMYELEPAAGLKASRVIGLSDDIARSMSALACRCSTIPGRSVIGIELPNELRERVLLREILAAKAWGDSAHALPLALGKDIGGEPVVANLARMPHLLIAGTTGSGKSVAINTMILSLLYKLSPAECRLIMIDPKMLELSVYDGIPHLLSPVVTDPKKAVVALKWAVAEMEERYRKMSKMGVRNIDGYNARVKDALGPRRGLHPHRADRLRRRDRRAGVRDRGVPPAGDALHRRHRRRDGRPDDGRRQGDRGLHPAPRPDGARLRHPPDHGDPAPVRRRHHRHDQGELPDPHLLPGHLEDRQPHHPRRDGRRAAARPGRHALHGRRRPDHPRPRPLRLRRGGRGGGEPPEDPRHPRLRRRHPRRPRRRGGIEIDLVLGLGGNARATTCSTTRRWRSSPRTASARPPTSSASSRSATTRPPSSSR